MFAKSQDGTSIAYERTGGGPALILVDAAGHYRELSSFGGLIGLLAWAFTVYHYDRRGRGASTDTRPYAVEREVEDLAALIEAAGGEAHLYGFSSGGLLALRAAADGLPVRKLAVLEPPIETDDDRSAQSAFMAELGRRIDAGQRTAAVEFFLTNIGVPDTIIDNMRADQSWTRMESVAHTLIYDGMISETFSTAVLASVKVPTLVLDSMGSGDALTSMAATVAAAIPHSSHRSLAGQWHGVADDILAPVLTEFLLAPLTPAPLAPAPLAPAPLAPAPPASAS